MWHDDSDARSDPMTKHPASIGVQRPDSTPLQAEIAVERR